MPVVPVNYIVDVSFFVGSLPEGQSIGEGTTFLTDGPAPSLPPPGTLFRWADHLTGAKYMGTVTFAGAHEFFLANGFVTIKLQIYCVNSYRV